MSLIKLANKAFYSHSKYKGQIFRDSDLDKIKPIINRVIKRSRLQGGLIGAAMASTLGAGAYLYKKKKENKQ